MFKLLLKSLTPKRRREIAVKCAVDQWELDHVLVRFGRNAAITIGQATEGIFVVGGTGSGKTSGSGELFATAFLSKGFGGLVLCAKPSEAALWREYAALTGRADDLVLFGPDEPFRFNFLDFELSRAGRGAGHTENIVNQFTTIIDVIQKASGKNMQGGEQYWVLATRQLIRNITDLLILARGNVSIPDMYKIAISAPTSPEQIKSETWKGRSYCFACLREADLRPKSEDRAEDFALVADYFMIEWPELSEKTRSVILSTFTAMADVLNRGILKTLFCGATTITPQDIEKGKIVVVNLPVKEFSEVGLIANIVWKTSFQRSIERRSVDADTRPAFLWQDEAQLFLNTEADTAFQSTARSSRVATVCMTQSISSLYAVAGDGQKGKSQIDSLIGNLCLKIFHANSDYTTNLWCADLIGKSRQCFFNGSTSNGASDDSYSMLFGGGGMQSSGGFSEQMEYDVPPNTFLSLRNGGPRNNYLVDALLFSSATQFPATGKNYMPVTFEQRQR